MVETALGKAAMAVSGRGVLAVSLQVEEEPFLDELSADFSASTAPQREDEVLRSHGESLRQYLETGEDEEPLPLDLRGTDFQVEVWQALRKLPRGRTRTYGEVARMLGKPGAARAVAGACAANRLAVLVPCHRVVRADGGLGGYRWGLDLKRRLLERESQTVGLFG